MVALPSPWTADRCRPSATTPRSTPACTAAPAAAGRLPASAQTSGAARKPRRPYHHGNLRRALLDEALATIRTEGVDGLTLREIGARLGVSRTALYRHFADKRALLTAVAIEGVRTLRQHLVTAWDEGGRGPAAFQSMGVAYVHFAIANPVALSRDVQPLHRPAAA
jgi:AcrR family transcriptional regulator